jgi:type II secretory pathway pseudopilin PulG
MRRGSNRRGQIWVETVIYTLIGMAVIGLVLAGALPKINEKKDSLTIERSIEALGNIDDKIYAVLGASGSRRVVNLEVKSGSLVIDPAANTISWIIDSSFAYSEVDKPVPFGKLSITTTKKGDYEVKLELKYNNFNLKYDGQDTEERRFNVAPTPYVLVINNNGRDVDGRILIDLSEA